MILSKIIKRVYDVRKCFDELDLDKCVNDLYEAGIDNDKLNMIYEGNSNSNMAINVPSIGLTERTQIKKKVTQGGPLGPTICAIHIDKIGKEMINRNEFCYKFKNIDIPALSMIDDLLCIAECGCNSVEANSFINAQFELKNLHLNKDKCHQIHIGRPNKTCPKLKAHGDEIMKVCKDKYLGDVISQNGNNDDNIRSKISNGMAAMSNILNILREVSLGEFYFQIGFLLRQTMFLSTVLLNSEAWVNLTVKNIEELEKIDVILLRRIFEAPISTPTKLIYLESGTYPIRFHIKARRLMYLHYLLNRNKNELVSKILYTQINDKTKNDWYSTVQCDLKDLGINYLELEEIKNMKKDAFKKLIKEKISDIALKYLLEGNEDKSKSKYLKYYQLKIQSYLLSKNTTTRQKKYLFHFRTRMIKVGHNYGRKVSCPVCQTEAGDTQEHMFNCFGLKLLSSELYHMKNLKYADIYCSDPQKLDDISKICESVTRKREAYLS